MGAVITGEWQRGPVIGRGASATVSIAADRRTGAVFAVKSVEAARAGVLRRERGVLDAVGPSPHVVSCLGSGASADGVCFDLFLEYAPGGSLADEARRRRCDCEEDDEAWVRARSADVLRGLAHVHATGWAHCDVKGRNVLLGADGRAMLADFGCARWTGDEGSSNAGSGLGIRGTPAFMAPEAARGEAQGLAADVWALGCTVIEMAAGGAAPWTGRFADPVAALHHVAHSGEVPEPPAWLSDEGKDFLARCLVRDPAKRWTAAQLLHHPFVAAAAGSDSSAAAAKGAPIEQRVSPKSILDQAFWEECESELGSDSSATDESETTAAAALTPADRVGALAGGGAPDWTWISGEEDWITVFAADIAAPDELDAPTPPKFDADTAESFDADAGGISMAGASEEPPHIVVGGEHMGADASSSRGGRGHGGGASSSAGSRRGDRGGSNNECGCTSGRGKMNNAFDPMDTEIMACILVLQVAMVLGIGRIVLETVALMVQA
ncbi:hypothetical protein PR202_gb07004 [Eleusine coracana subsp. coracana]|uniref:Protein kinase domain-containing protein n=1 Tax=Eleusine coracana subsp. coracana TaxID=191504 RepID=A0AAV5EAV7_ELECO|nr:hypothetical protein PR202_gb07004 [Eleusine coracana subsp. coracana]